MTITKKELIKFLNKLDSIYYNEDIVLHHEYNEKNTTEEIIKEVLTTISKAIYRKDKQIIKLEEDIKQIEHNERDITTENERLQKEKEELSKENNDLRLNNIDLMKKLELKRM